MATINEYNTGLPVTLTFGKQDESPMVLTEGVRETQTSPSVYMGLTISRTDSPVNTSKSFTWSSTPPAKDVVRRIHQAIDKSLASQANDDTVPFMRIAPYSILSQRWTTALRPGNATAQASAGAGNPAAAAAAAPSQYEGKTMFRLLDQSLASPANVDPVPFTRIAPYSILSQRWTTALTPGNATAQAGASAGNPAAAAAAAPSSSSGATSRFEQE